MEIKLDGDRVWLNEDDEEKVVPQNQKVRLQSKFKKKKELKRRLLNLRNSLDYLLDFVDATPEFQRFHFTLKEMQQIINSSRVESIP